MSDNNIDALLFKVLTGRATAEEERTVRAASTPEIDERRRTLEKILALAAEADASGMHLPPPTADDLLASVETRTRTPLRTPARRSSWSLPMALAASLIIGFGIAFLWQAIPDRDGGIAVREVTTGSNETATVLLDDGTVARLAPRSRLRLSENGGSREVSLVGRGYFAVAKRNGELFRVLTPQGEVTVLGTRFELNSDSEDLRLTVVEGTVELAVDENVERVESGQIARVLRGTTLPVQTVENPAELIDWMGNFLAFQATPLGEAVREIERLYGVTVLIEDPALSSRTVTSHFSDWPLATMIDALCLIAHANCSIEGDTVRMKSG